MTIVELAGGGTIASHALGTFSNDKFLISMRPDGYKPLDRLDEAPTQKTHFCLIFSLVIRGTTQKERPGEKTNPSPSTLPPPGRD
jgi:hypothetical protein